MGLQFGPDNPLLRLCSGTRSASYNRNDASKSFRYNRTILCILTGILILFIPILLIRCQARMGGKASKPTNDQGLVPRDGSDEIEIPTRKLGNQVNIYLLFVCCLFVCLLFYHLSVTQEQFDELMHKFTLLEQLMLRDKSKLSNLETSVTEYQQEKQKLRQSFVEIDSEVIQRCQVVYWVYFILN